MSSAETARDPVEVNGRRYAWPARPLVVVCIDGSEPGYPVEEGGSDAGGYIERAVEAGCMPYTASMLERGTRRLADCVVPTFTNPNNLSIVTGVPPSVHGICGNFFYDRDSGDEVMMNEPRFLRAPTVLAAFAGRGARVAVITAKDKLRRLLGQGLPMGDAGCMCFSAEKADQATREENGIDGVPALAGMAVPSVYSAELSEFVFAAGVEIVRRHRPDLTYLSTTDYVQHKHAPGSPAANAFYAMMDRYWSELDALGCTLALTADHGMKAKHDASGRPRIVFLQTLLDEWLSPGEARVILPITDPYVVHHGALGGFATVYVPATAGVAELLERLQRVDGVECALTREAACERFALPPDRVGDLVVIATPGAVLGSAPERHDLSGLDAPLRSHGGLSERKVPLLINRATPSLPAGRALSNYDILDVALNHAA